MSGHSLETQHKRKTFFAGVQYFRVTLKNVGNFLLRKKRNKNVSVFAS